MFFCMGENESQDFSVGKGETIEKALSDWSTSKDIWVDIVTEFNQYDPFIVRGEELRIEVECPPPNITIL